MIGPEAPYEDRARHLRALYRQNKAEQREVSPGKLVVDPKQQAEQWRIVKAEYDRLFPEREIRLALILVNVWAEERELAGQRYDRAKQAWVDAEGDVVWD